MSIIVKIVVEGIFRIFVNLGIREIVFCKKHKLLDHILYLLIYIVLIKTTIFIITIIVQ